MTMQLRHAKVIVNEPKYLEAQKVIAEAEAEEKGKAEVEAEVAENQESDLQKRDELPVEDQESNLQERVD